MITKYDAIREKIEHGDYETTPKKTKWAGAGAVITKEPDSAYTTDPSIAYCCTSSASAYIWLLEELKAIVDIDYFSKYAFYPTLVKTITTVDKEICPIREKLLKILNEMERETWQV